MPGTMKLKRATALASLLALTAVAIAPAAVAQNGTMTSLSERQSIKTDLSPEGEVRSSRLYTQILAEGEGSIELTVPTATKGLRNLDGFTKPAVAADAAVWNLTLPKGQPVARRTVSDYDRELPVSVQAAYTLDGEPIKPADLVGKSGLVSVTYTVKNLTAKPTEIEVKDGLGRKTTETVDVMVPLAGSFSTSLDGRFSALDAPTAVQAGDGRGNTVLNWSLLLFEPLGSNVSTMTWSAQVKDAVVPAATAQVVPVVADGSPVDSGIDNFGDAVSQTTALTQGSTEIDRNTVRVAAGAQQLLDGVTKLADGSRALADGLGDAASGSGELAEGAGKLADGSDELAEGAGKAAAGGKKLATGLGELSGGAGQLSAGLESAREGGTKLSTGLGELAGGAGQLSAGLDSARDGGDKLSAGLGELSNGAGQLSAGLGSAREGGQKLVVGATATQEGAAKAADSSAQIAAGARLLEAGLKDLADAADKLPALAAGIEAYRAQALGGIGAAIGTPGSTFGAGTPSVRTILAGLTANLPNAQAGAAGVAAALKDSADIAGDSGVALQDLADAQAGLVGLIKADLDCTAVPTACARLDALVGAAPPSVHITKAAGESLAANKPALLGAAGILDQVADGLAVTKGDGTPGAQGAVAGAEQILAGVHHSVTNEDGSAQLGLDALQDGVTKLRDGVRTKAAASAGSLAGYQEDLSAGLDFLAGDEALGAVKKGAGDLAGGLVQLDEGAGKLAAGATAAAEGSKELAGGMNQLADGGKRLNEGAFAAAAGSKELSGGINQLADGGRKLHDGSKTAASGAGELATGLGKLDDGTDKLADGAKKLDVGANKLADGLEGAATGSLTIADGLQMAKLGNTNLVNGAQALTEKGTSVLAGEVNDATIEQARKVATLKAASERARAEGLPYPAADGALATGVYRLDLASAEGETSDTTTRLLLALLVLAAMGAGAALTRKTARVVAG